MQHSDSNAQNATVGGASPVPRSTSDVFGATPSTNMMAGSPSGLFPPQRLGSEFLATVPSMEDLSAAAGGQKHHSIAGSPCHSSQAFTNNSMYPSYLLANATAMYGASGHHSPLAPLAPQCPLCPPRGPTAGGMALPTVSCTNAAAFHPSDDLSGADPNSSSASAAALAAAASQNEPAPPQEDHHQLQQSPNSARAQNTPFGAPHLGHITDHPRLAASALCALHAAAAAGDASQCGFPPTTPASGAAAEQSAAQRQRQHIPATAASRGDPIPVIDPALIHLAIAKAQLPPAGRGGAARRGAGGPAANAAGNSSDTNTPSGIEKGGGASGEGSPQQHNTTDMIRLGVCCMRKKLNSPTMTAMLERFEGFGNFAIVRFEEEMLLNEHPSRWPTVDVMIAFFSSGFPLEKAVAYADMHPHIFFITEPRNQRVLLDRRDVYNALRLNNVPHPRVLFCNRDGHRGLPESVFEEYDDYIVVDGERLDKPFVEKPVSAEDHSVQVYYKGGGMRKLFRKVGNKSSDHFPEVSTVRRNGSFIYEAFIETEGKRDIKCYTVGPTYVFAETRKAPTGDGVVLRREDGKEMRDPITLRGAELMAARKVIKVFRQIVCGFDILRQADGKFFVCDVNGWSFVKNVPEYVDRATSIMRDIFIEEVRKRGLHREFRNATMTRNLLGVVSVMRHADRTPKQKVKIVVNVEPLLLAVFDGERKVKDEIVFKSGHPKLAAIHEVVCALLSSTPACSDDTDGDDCGHDRRVVRGTITPMTSCSAPNASAMGLPYRQRTVSEHSHCGYHPTLSSGAGGRASAAVLCPSSAPLGPAPDPARPSSFPGSCPKPIALNPSASNNGASNNGAPLLSVPSDDTHNSFVGEGLLSPDPSILALSAAALTPSHSGAISPPQLPSPGLPPNPEPCGQPHYAPLGTVLTASDGLPSSTHHQAPQGHGQLQSISAVCTTAALTATSSEPTAGSPQLNLAALPSTACAASSSEGGGGTATPSTAVNFSVRTGDNISRSVLASLRLMREVLARQHEGLKVQVKPREWDAEGNCVEALLVCKWGGWLTDAGHKQSQMMGRHFLKRIFGVNELNSVQKSRYAVQTNNERRVIHTAVEFSSAMLGEAFDERRCVVNENLLGKTLGAKDHMSEYSDKIKKMFNAEDPAEVAEYLKLPGMGAIVDSPVVPDGKRTPRGAMQTMRALIEALCQSFAHGSTSQVRLYRDESMALLRQRWTNLLNALYQRKTNTFDTTKIPDIFDNISYDVCYNQRAFKGHLDMYPLFTLAEALSTFISDGEFGITPAEKRASATLFATPLLERISDDLRQIAAKQGPTMRMYFTSESHVTGLKNLLYNSPEPFLRMEEPMELHFLSHFVFKLYRYPGEGRDRQYQIEVHFSMGMDKNMFGIVQEQHVEYASVTPMIRIHNNLDLETLGRVATRFASEANTASSTPGGTPSVEVQRDGTPNAPAAVSIDGDVPTPEHSSTKREKKPKAAKDE